MANPTRSAKEKAIVVPNHASTSYSEADPGKSELGFVPLLRDKAIINRGDGDVKFQAF